MRYQGLKVIKRRRGIAFILASVSLIALMSMFALVVDFGRIFVAKNELQNVADSAALAAVVEIPNGYSQTRDTAISFAAAQKVAGSPITMTTNDVTTGNYDFSTHVFLPNALPSNAVQVEARRTDGSPSGPLGLLFAPLFGQDTSNVRASSLAILDNHVVGVKGKSRLIPYSVVDYVVDADLNGEFDIGNVVDIHPIHSAPGNFGFLDFNGGSNGIPELRHYIENGYDGDFIIPVGGSVQVSGSPGINGNALLDSFLVLVGDEAFLPVHNWAVNQGANTIYNIISILAVRVLAVHLTGAPSGRFIRVEIINFASSVLAVDTNAGTNSSLAKPRLAG